MVQLWTKDIDKEMLILEVLVQEYEKNGVKEIRRAALKELCDDMLNEKTEGRMEAYGGSFQRGLKVLEEKMALNCVKKGPKLTLIIPDIPRIKSLLLGKKLDQSLNEDSDIRLTEQEIPATIWEKLLEQDVEITLEKGLKEINRKSNPSLDFNDELIQRSYLPLKETAKKINSYIIPNLFDFIISHKDENFALNEDIATDIGQIASKIMSKNITAPFKVLIEYKGIPGNATTLGLLFGTHTFNIATTYFVQWAQDVFHYKVSNEDIIKLQEGHIDLLTKTAKEYFDIFYNSLQTYVNIPVFVKKNMLV
jgi:hypothetical protein